MSIRGSPVVAVTLQAQQTTLCACYLVYVCYLQDRPPKGNYWVEQDVH